MKRPTFIKTSRPGDAWESQAEGASHVVQNGFSFRAPSRGFATSSSPAASAAMPMSPAMHATLSAPGNPLPAPTRTQLESRLGHDFSQVRIHDDAQAGQSARDAFARAYTVGDHVVFAPGAYQPASPSGLPLLAHELAHVAQHRSQPGEPVLSRTPGPGGRARPLVDVSVQNQATTIDRSHTVDEITHMFYDVPSESIGPGELYPAGHMIILCDDYKYGLTQNRFSITYTLSDSDRRHTERRRDFLGSPATLSECWYSHVRINITQSQTIYLPNDLATTTSIGGTPCLNPSQTPDQANAETLVHERIHEADNVRASQEVGTEALSRVGSTIGVGDLMAEAEFTSDPAARLQACARNVRRRLNDVRDELEISFYRRSLQYAVNLDPWDAGDHSASFQRMVNVIRRRAAEREAN